MTCEDCKEEKRCSICGKVGQIDEHHLVYPWEGNEMTIPLCKSHHAKQPGKLANPMLRYKEYAITSKYWHEWGYGNYLGKCEDCCVKIWTITHGGFGRCIKCYQKLYRSNQLFDAYFLYLAEQEGLI